MKVRYNFKWDKTSHIKKQAGSLGRDIALFFPMLPWTPPINNLEGRVTYYDPARIARMRKRLAGTSKKQYLRDILRHIFKRGMTDRERVAAVCGFVSRAIYYNPIQQPQENHTGEMLTDAVELLELHDGRCGQGVEVTLALLQEADIECRRLNVNHHVTAEARYLGGWHLADALMFGEHQPERDGEVVNVGLLKRDPYFADSFPMPHFVYSPFELLSRDGFRQLGYFFGEWGSLAYYSYYMWGEEEYPPFQPFVLPVERLAKGKIRLRWSESVKRGGGTIRYRVRLYADRGCKEVLTEKVVNKPSMAWKVPEENRMYFFGVSAIDDHIKKNPATWYPEARSNFVLVPEDQYGWYGVV
jgi:hypothetical protein